MSDPTPVNVFAPGHAHAKQAEVFYDPARFKILRAGRKFRKTSLGISWLAYNALTTGLTCPYVAPNRLQAKNIAWKDHVLRLLDELKAKKVPYKLNETELTITFPNNGRIQLLGVENKETLRGISNWGAIFCDEYDDWEEDIWSLIIRPNLMVNQAPAIFAGTPKGMRGLFGLSQMKVQSAQGVEVPMFKEFHYTSYDNPDLSREELAAVEREYKELGEDYYRQEIMAEYVKPAGVVYNEWDMTHFQPLEYDPNLPLHITFDWGINDPTAVIWIQPGPGGEVRVIDYYEASDANIEHFVSLIRSKTYRPADLYTGDPAGNARSLQTGTSVIQMLAAKGIYVRTMNGVRIPEQIRVTHGTIPRLFISSTNPNCERFRDCCLNYHYPKKRENAFNQENEIPVHDQFSHAMRAYEYYCVNAKDITDPDEYDLPTYKPTFSKTGY